MTRRIHGQLHKVSKDFRIVSIQIVDKLEFFYLQPRFVKQFRQYLYPGVFVTLTCDEKQFKMKRRLVFRIITFEKIMGNRYHRSFSYFDQKITKQTILEKMNAHPYRMFLDLEMTLQRSKMETEEIVQVGYLLVNQHDQVIESYNHHVRPTMIKDISDRTLEFLNIDLPKINNGIAYVDFYQHFKTTILHYEPAIITWGNNDRLALDKSYIINKVSPIGSPNDFLNLQQVHKEFYNVNHEMGLFNTAKIYEIACGVQIHDAYHDAEITRLIFNKFYTIAYNDLEFDFKQRLSKLLEE